MSSDSITKPAKLSRWRELWGPYSQLLPFLKPYWFRFAAGVLAGAGAGIVSGLLAFVTKHVMDRVFPSGGGKVALLHAQGAGPSIESIIWVCATIPAIMLLRSALTYLNVYCMAWVSLKLLVDIRTKLFRHIIHQSLDFFNKSRSGNLISRVSNDTRMAQQALTQVTSDLVTQPVAMLTAIIALTRLDAIFTGISLVLFPLCLVPIVIYGKKVRRSGSDEEAGVGAMMVILSEAFAGIRVVKALAREEHEANQFAEAGKAQFGVSMRVKKASEIVGPIIEAVSALGVGVALVYVYYSHMSAGTFLGLMIGLFMLYDPVKKLSKVHLQMQKCLASTTRIFDLMNTTPTVKDADGAIKLRRCIGDIRFENVSFAYLRRVPAVTDINLHIAPGKTYALVGASGAGKSTLLALLLRFYDPSTGSIQIDGHDLRAITQQSLRENIGIVTQDTFLFHETIFKNIQYGRFDATPEEVYTAARQAYAHDFILAQPHGYDTVIGDKGCLLSGGQQQRLAVARALLRNAPILLLDEATSALDSESEKQIQSALETLSAGRTVIAIAHRLSTILNADQIVVLDRGQIKEIGPHAELFEKSGFYRRLYDMQFHPHEEMIAADAI